MVKAEETPAPEITEEAIKKLFNIGYRNFIAGDYPEAADALQEVCRFNSEKYGEKDDKCADALLLYGRTLLELGRAENCVLGNALKGWREIEYDSQDNIDSEQFENPEKVSPDEREKLRNDVNEAMAEADTIEEEESKDAKDEEKSEDKKMETEETKAEETKPEEKKEEAKPEESKEEPMSTDKMDTETTEAKPAEEKPKEPASEEQDSLAEDPDSMPSLQLAWEIIELARVIFNKRPESMERDIKISECYLRLGEVSLEIENYANAVGDFLECQALQKKHFDKIDRRIAETHYHLGVAYGYQKRHDSAKEHFGEARKIIDERIDSLTLKFDELTEKDGPMSEQNELTNEIAQLKDLLPDLNSKLEDIEATLKSEPVSDKVSEHLNKDNKVLTDSNKTNESSNIQHLVKRKAEEMEKLEAVEKKAKSQHQEKRFPEDLRFVLTRWAKMSKLRLQLISCGLLSKGVYAWVESYDGGEDDEKVIKIMLPMIAIAVLACVVGYYIKNKFCKVDEDEENKKEKDLQRDLEKMRFPPPKANKPWLNMPPTNNAPRVPPGGYEYTLPGYPSYGDKRTNSRESGKNSNGSSGYQSHMTVNNYHEKKRSRPEHGRHGGRQMQETNRTRTVPNPQMQNPTSRPSRKQRP
ncbi:Oidioi.mRNA.OKI2018_I69.XSR.g14213.t2.cds [Oikopleura dioica]|uniref:Oidioi.mRNA.OKI2018_I69.XSR.g14213.t2.cds n=1 Tax=Oikopleura dioica TaxID=34765 RepID=A0ABN7S947_OIKDI|nr:Oidioi.mRNA.OKI2018_I69.XSR.g14213.t2.cds [Oikopleura dioica]